MILTLTNEDINKNIFYNENKEEMLKDTKNNLYGLGKFEKIIVPGNINFQNLRTEFKSFKDLIDYWHPIGEKLFPFQGFDAKSLDLNSFNLLIKEYLKNNLSMNVRTEPDCEQRLTVEITVSLDGEEILKEYDFCTIR